MFLSKIIISIFLLIINVNHYRADNQSKIIWKQNLSPVVLSSNLFIAKHETLVIKPGVVIKSHTGVSIIVNGTLIAEGTRKNPIIFTNYADSIQPKQSLFRLTDGDNVNRGNFEIFIQSKWRVVCTNIFKNWTSIVSNVVCNSMGYSEGFFYHSRIFNIYDTKRPNINLLYSPKCLGTENSLFECQHFNQSVHYRNDVCVNKRIVGIECKNKVYTSLKNPKPPTYWGGFKFFNSTLLKKYHPHVSHDFTTSAYTNPLYFASASILKNVIILNAGINFWNDRTASIECSPSIPKIENVLIENSAGIGLKSQDIILPISINNLTVKNSFQHGVYIKSRLGLISISNSTFRGNIGMGMKLILIDHRWPIHDSVNSMCSKSSSINQIYPAIFVAGPPPYENNLESKLSRYNCSRTLITSIDKLLTISFLMVDMDLDTSASITFFDGTSNKSPIIASFYLHNNTLPSAINSMYNYIYIEFQSNYPSRRVEKCHWLPSCVLVSFLVTSDYLLSKDSERSNAGIEIVSNNFLYNQQGALHVQNMRSVTFIKNNSFNYNSGYSNLKLDAGAGRIIVEKNQFHNNSGNAMNITYAGGETTLSFNFFNGNSGSGINITFSSNVYLGYMKRMPTGMAQKTIIYRNHFSRHVDIPVNVGNFCTGVHQLTINNTKFQYNHAAIKVDSCWQNSPFKMLNLTNVDFRRDENKFQKKRVPGFEMSNTLFELSKILGFNPIYNNVAIYHYRFYKLMWFPFMNFLNISFVGTNFDAIAFFYNVPLFNFTIAFNQFVNNTRFQKIFDHALTNIQNSSNSVVSLSFFADDVVSDPHCCFKDFFYHGSINLIDNIILSLLSIFGHPAFWGLFQKRCSKRDIFPNFKEIPKNEDIPTSEYLISLSPLYNALCFISNNTFTNNENGLIKIENSNYLYNLRYSIPKLYLRLQGNILNKNKMRTKFGIKLILDRFSFNHQSVLVKHNIFTNNNVLCKNTNNKKMQDLLNLKNELVTSNDSYSKFLDSNNNKNFTSRDLDGLLQTMYNAQFKDCGLFLTSFGNIVLKYNVFNNFDIKYQIFGYKRFRQHFLHVDATLNYWNTVIYSNISTLIFDNRYDADLFTINYHPALKYNDFSGMWITDDSRNEINPFIIKRFHFNGTQCAFIGGIILKSLQYLKNVKIVYVFRDVQVSNSSKFVVDSNVEFYFMKNTGIYVYGAIDFDGVTLFKYQSDWKGVHLISSSRRSNLKNLVIGGVGGVGYLNLNLPALWINHHLHSVAECRFENNNLAIFVFSTDGNINEIFTNLTFIGNNFDIRVANQQSVAIQGCIFFNSSKISVQYGALSDLWDRIDYWRVYMDLIVGSHIFDLKNYFLLDLNTFEWWNGLDDVYQSYQFNKRVNIDQVIDANVTLYTLAPKENILVRFNEGTGNGQYNVDVSKNVFNIYGITLNTVKLHTLIVDVLNFNHYRNEVAFLVQNSTFIGKNPKFYVIHDEFISIYPMQSPVFTFYVISKKPVHDNRLLVSIKSRYINTSINSKYQTGKGLIIKNCTFQYNKNAIQIKIPVYSTNIYGVGIAKSRNFSLILDGVNFYENWDPVDIQFVSIYDLYSFVKILQPNESKIDPMDEKITGFFSHRVTCQMYVSIFLCKFVKNSELINLDSRVTSKLNYGYRSDSVNFKIKNCTFNDNVGKILINLPIYDSDDGVVMDNYVGIMNNWFLNNNFQIIIDGFHGLIDVNQNFLNFNLLYVEKMKRKISQSLQIENNPNRLKGLISLMGTLKRFNILSNIFTNNVAYRILSLYYDNCMPFGDYFHVLIESNIIDNYFYKNNGNEEKIDKNLTKSDIKSTISKAWFKSLKIGWRSVDCLIYLEKYNNVSINGNLFDKNGLNFDLIAFNEFNVVYPSDDENNYGKIIATMNLWLFPGFNQDSVSKNDYQEWIYGRILSFSRCGHKFYNVQSSPFMTFPSKSNEYEFLKCHQFLEKIKILVNEKNTINFTSTVAIFELINNVKKYLSINYIDSDEQVNSFVPHAKILAGTVWKSTILKYRTLPYVFKQDVTVMPLISLTIEAGCEIILGHNVQVVVYGFLIAEGTESRKIMFDSVYSDSQDSIFYYFMKLYHLRTIDLILLQDYSNTEEYDGESNLMVNYQKFNKINNSCTFCHFNRENFTFFKDSKDSRDLTFLENFTFKPIRLIDKYSALNVGRGFLQIYNKTIVDWTLMCDQNFGLLEARVVCRQMGFPFSPSIHVWHNKYWDVYSLGYLSLHLKNEEFFHRLSYVCTGYEENLNDCEKHYNIGLKQCIHKKKIVVVQCVPPHDVSKFVKELKKYQNMDSVDFKLAVTELKGRYSTNLEGRLDNDEKLLIDYDKFNNFVQNCNDDIFEYVGIRYIAKRNANKFENSWGNIIIFPPNNVRFDFTASYNYHRSFLKYVIINNAGKMYNQIVPCIQSIRQSVDFSDMNVINCYSTAIESISPLLPILLNLIKIQYSYSFSPAINIVDITPAISNTLYKFDDAVINHIPNNILLDIEASFASPVFINMCSPERITEISSSIIAVFSGGNYYKDCFHTFRNYQQGGQVVAKLILLNLPAPTIYFRNCIDFYTNDKMNVTNYLTSIDSSYMKAYQNILVYSRPLNDTLSVRIQMQPKSPDYGFILEISPIENRRAQNVFKNTYYEHKVENCTFSNNGQSTALAYTSIGFIGASLAFRYNVVKYCGKDYNFYNSSNRAILQFNVQNVERMEVCGNFFKENYGGGIEIKTDPYQSRSSALVANITFNNWKSNLNGIILYLYGSTYSNYFIYKNFVSSNYAGLMRNLIFIRNGSVLFSHNIFAGNRARCIVNSSISRHSIIKQRYIWSSFYENVATGPFHTTFFIDTPHHKISNNYLVNRKNFFELVTVNRTRYRNQQFPAIVATNNYWGESLENFVQGRIWDYVDDMFLIQVKYRPYFYSNTSLIEGRCIFGWRLFQNRCYTFMGGVANYKDARQHCKHEKSKLADGRNWKTISFFRELSATYTRKHVLLWTRPRRGTDSSKCHVIDNYSLREHENCDIQIPFICEKDPYVETIFSPYVLGYGISAFVLLFMILLIVLILVYIKSHHRKEQSVIRQDTLSSRICPSNRSDTAYSLKSIRSIKSKSSAVDLKYFSNVHKDSFVSAPNNSYNIYSSKPFAIQNKEI
ncbi:hypothetical protein A3Q56_02377 [Intoshia linei]|uniref:SRCR domain-containing protein n=1 Tax=Intoshia linei TaxID=1819745 RepID=A0A177B8B8_9BILA|nr:hypothetical protein A3Q56_02377 [Intoshia linei]